MGRESPEHREARGPFSFSGAIMEWICLAQLAQTPTASIDLAGGTIGALVGALAGGGFSLWYGYYMTTVATPRMQAEARAEREGLVADLKNERMAFLTELKIEREAFRGELREERTLRKDSADKLNVTLDKLCDSVVAFRDGKGKA